MKIVVFGPDRRVGVLVQGHVVDLAGADPRLPWSLEELIVGGRPALDLVAEVVSRAEAGSRPLVPVAEAGLHAPAVRRPRIGCAAGNYAGHTAGSAARKGAANSNALAGISEDAVPSDEEIERATRTRTELRGFWKDFALPVGTGGEVTLPARAEQFDYEGEVAVVIGAPAKDVPSGQGDTYVWGVTLLNDWSIRGASRKDSHSFNLGKNFDGAASIGPCIVVDEVHPAGLHVETRVNGELRQSYDSADMIFSHAEFIEYLSRDLTLLPGDMISGGSGPGTAIDSGAAFLQAGDLVEVSSPAIGVLSNVVVAKKVER